MEINGNGNSRYTTGAIVFHWVVAILVLAMIGLAFYMTGIPKGNPDRAFYFNLHKSIGVTTALLVIARLWWRARNPPPALPSSMPGWEIQASRASHALLYMCIIVMPLSGFAATQFTKYGVNYFGLFKIPPMGFENKNIYDFLQGIHGVTAIFLMVLVVIHVLAAFKHLLIDRDKVFQRMPAWKIELAELKKPPNSGAFFLLVRPKGEWSAFARIAGKGFKDIRSGIPVDLSNKNHYHS